MHALHQPQIFRAEHVAVPVDQFELFVAQIGVGEVDVVVLQGGFRIDRELIDHRHHAFQRRHVEHGARPQPDAVEAGFFTLFKLERLLGRAGVAELQRPVAVQGVPVAVDLHRVGEAGVCRAAVVALEVVVDDVLPVGRGSGDEARRQLEIVYLWAGFAHFGAEARQLVFHRAGLRVQINVDKPGVLFDPHRHQVRVFLIEVLHVFAVARVRQFAVQLERPGVIRAGDDVFARPSPASSWWPRCGQTL